MTRRRSWLLAALILFGPSRTAVAGLGSVLLEAPDGPGSLRVVYTGRGAVEVAGKIDVEYLHDGQWQASGVTLHMLERCSTPTPGIVDAGRVVDSASMAAALSHRSLRPERVRLDSGVPFDVVRWDGWSCSGQCSHMCRTKARLRGTFRPVLTVLPSATRVVGPVWRMG